MVSHKENAANNDSIAGLAAKNNIEDNLSLYIDK